MRPFRLFIAMGLLFVFLGGCAGGWPQARLDTYLGPQPKPEKGLTQLADLPGGPIKAGLLVINDTAAQDSAPKLSKEALASLTKHVQAQLMHQVPIEVATVISPTAQVAPTENLATVLQLAKDQGMDYIIMTILSSTEIEVPDRLPLQSSGQGVIGRGLLVGYRAENLALAELALVDVEAKKVVARADGQAWASLERLDVPLESNVYPVVRLGLEVPPIYPTEENRAHDVMRAVASSAAINQAVMHLKEAWDNPEYKS